VLPGVTLRLERLEEVDALWMRDGWYFCADDGAVPERCVRPGAITGDIDNDANMKLVGYRDQNKIATPAVFLNLFHCHRNGDAGCVGIAAVEWSPDDKMGSLNDVHTGGNNSG
jgi:hypothetical protein